MSYRMMEESVLVAKECGRTDEVCRLALGATQLYREHGSPASALYLLKRAAKILENKVHMVPKALIGLAVVTIKTDGWVFIFRL